MLGKFSVLAAALCVGSYAMAASPSIGSVTSRGELKIDSYVVNGSGTVFDGSVVETGQSALSIADLRLGNDAVISLSVSSLGTLHRDHFELQRGMVELSSTNSFRVEVNGLNVAPPQAHSTGLISIEPGNSVKVAAKTGDLEVKDATGRTIALVHPGHPLAFSSLDGRPSTDFAAAGVVSSEKGRYYLRTSETDVKYELKGDNLQNFDGSSVIASGTLDSLSAATAGAAGLILARNVASSGSGAFTLPGQSLQSKALVSGLSIGESKPATSSGTVCYPPSMGGICCPAPSPTALPLCCPGQPSFGFCCVGQMYPASKCHHSN
jgi:hypothetical protein